MTIDERRKAIDKIDDQITSLYNERMKIVKEIGQEKAKTGGNVLDISREKDILARAVKNVEPEIRLFTKQLFETLFETSKTYQSKFLKHSSNISEEIRAHLAKNREVFPDYASVACQGIKGAYSNLAANKLFQICDITFFKNFEGVFNAVEKNLCEFGIIPIENSSVGSVNAVYDLMKEHKFYIVKSIKLPVKHCLLAKKGAKIEDIKEIISHEQALQQCENFIKTLKNVTITICDNTALAAKIVSESEKQDIAAISSLECANLYGLSLLGANIQNHDFNYTRFIVISKSLRIFKNSSKISIMVSLPHEHGSLNRLLFKFTSLGLNLTKLESRPVGGSSFEFLFYFDFEADIDREEVIDLLADLDNRSEAFSFLGSYNEV